MYLNNLLLNENKDERTENFIEKNIDGITLFHEAIKEYKRISYNNKHMRG